MDEGIAPVVSALSLFPEIKTIESCEGLIVNGYEKVPAGVVFEYGHEKRKLHSWKNVASFVFDFFAPELWALVNDDASLSMKLNYGSRFYVSLSLRPSAINGVSEAIKKIHSKWIKD